MTASRTIIRNIGTLIPMAGEPVSGAAVVLRGDAIEWCGLERDLAPALLDGGVNVDAGGGIVTPGLVECHTHLLFAGSRADEYESRATGVSYEEIARRGGGIVRTVSASRGASTQELVATAIPRAWSFLASGVTTIEVKSGYGLTLEHELRMLQAIGLLGDLTPATLVPTFLGAHSYPRDPDCDRAAHVDAIINEWIPAVAAQGIARFCDVFCENVAFSVADSERILLAARAHGLLSKVHAEQLSPSGAARMAARLGAVSAEHLDFATDDDIAAMARAGVVAVLLPGCPVSLCNHRWISARRFLDAGVRVALSTDFNPGSSVTMNLPLMGTFGMSFMGMSAMETWRSITVDAAAALSLPAGTGTIVPGAPADVVVWNCSDPREPFYNYGTSHVALVIKAGVQVVRRSRAGEVQFLLP